MRGFCGITFRLLKELEMLGKSAKHLLHCVLCIVVIVTVELIGGGIRLGEWTQPDFDPFDRYGYLWATILYLICLMPIVALPHTLCNFLGMILYNAFPDDVKLKGDPSKATFICIRTVTCGDYPQLVQQNVFRNINTCLDVGLDNFIVEVVTDKPINLPVHARIREIVIPKLYRTKSGALFKARALQYCLEDDVNQLDDSDWIVHLDEESILTKNSVRGILNFVLDGSAEFGQGVITYANENIVNWLTALTDCYRVADDLGKLQFQFKVFHKPLLGWKGAYIVSKVGPERKVSFDNGPDGSITEDVYFAMSATAHGYNFGFVEGDIWEESAFTIWDLIRQRKRWFQGGYLVVHSPTIPMRAKFMLFTTVYTCMFFPFITANPVLQKLYPVPCWQLLDFMTLFSMATTLYMCIFGVIKSFSFNGYGLLKLPLFLVLGVFSVILNVLVVNVTIIWGVFSNMHTFYVVKKEI